MRVRLHKFDAGHRFDDDDLHISLNNPRAVRRNCTARLSMDERRLLVMLATRPGDAVSTAEIIEALYGTRRDGGPDRANYAIAGAVMALRVAGPAFGFRIENIHGRGYRLDLLCELKASAA